MSFQFGGVVEWSEFNSPDAETLPVCKECGTRPPHALAIAGLDWAAAIYCPFCGAVWAVCKVCPPPLTLFKERKWLNHHSKASVRHQRLLQGYLCRSTTATSFATNIDNAMGAATNLKDDELYNTTNTSVETNSITSPVVETDQLAEQTNESFFETLRPFCTPPKPESFLDLFPDPKNCAYFQTQYQGHISGASILVAKAMHGSEQYSQVVHDCDALWSLLFSWLANELKPNQVMVLSVLLDYHLNGRQALVPKNPFKPPKVPTDVSEFSRFFGNGRNSVPSLSPRPTVQSIENSHVYVSLCDIVRDLLGHGHRVRPLSPVDMQRIHAQSPRGKEIYELALKVFPPNEPNGIANCFVLPLYLWDDDFDASNVKTLKNKVWCLMASLATPQEYIHTSCNTYLIGLGPSTESHEEVYELLQSDLNKLNANNQHVRPKFYYNGWKREVNVFVPIYSYQADRPAKAKATHTLLGGSTYHAHFGVSGNLYSIRDSIPSCQRCFQKRMDNSETSIGERCEYCLDWNILGASFPAHKDYPQPQDAFPLNNEEGATHMLKVKIVSFDSMKDAIIKCVNQVARTENSWSVLSAREFLRTECCSTALIDKVVKHAVAQQRSIKEADRHGLTPPPVVPFEVPASLQTPSLQMDLFISCLMHQLFLGVAKTHFADLLPAWLKTHKKHTRFIKDANKLLSSIKSLRLANCKAETITVETGKLGRYVSENYLALVRIGKWVCRDFTIYEPIDKPYEDPPGKKLSEYTLPQLKAWLRARCIPFHKDEDLLRKVNGIISEQPDQQPPPIANEPQSTAPLELVEDLTISMVAMISRLMIRGKVGTEHVADADRHVKIHLSTLDSFIHYRGGPTPEERPDKPIYIQRYNYISLLRIPNDLQRFGSLRLLWEGDGKAEASLPLLKDKIRSLTGKWAFHAAEKYYKHRSIDRVAMVLMEKMKNLSSGNPNQNPYQKKGSNNLISAGVKVFGGYDGSIEEQTDDESVPHYNKDFLVYVEVERAHLALQQGEPLSAVSFDEGHNFALLVKSQNGSLAMVELVRGNFHESKCGAAYFNWTIIDGSECTTPYPDCNSKTIVKHVKHNCLLLPLNPGDDCGIYYLITMDWKEMLADGTIQRPRVRKAKY